MRKYAFSFAVAMLIAFFSGCDHFDNPVELTEGTAIAIVLVAALIIGSAGMSTDRSEKKLHQRIDDLEHKIDSLEFKIDSLKDDPDFKIDSLEFKIDSLKDEVTALKNEIRWGN